MLWIHGSKDVMVSDMLPLDVAVLGLAGYIPGYPEPDKFPPQPIVGQIRTFLEERDEGWGPLGGCPRG